jgi:ferredoxin
MNDTDVMLHLDEVNRVASEYVKGSTEIQISKSLDMPRTRVVKLLDEWRGMIANNDAIRARAREALATADQHYNRLIQKAYEVIDAADSQSDLGEKSKAIKLILDIENKRIEMLQKAGLLENKEIAEELMAMENKQEILVKILREVSGKCDTCKVEVTKRLADVAKPDEVITVNVD